MKKTSFGIGIPTGTEGLMYPIPFAKVRDNIRIAITAEKLGYDSVWGNDHVSTQHYVKEEFDTPPNYYSPFLTLGAISENTKKLRIATALLVVPFRHPVIIAKEIATLDGLSDGRLIVGVGIGAYREEFEAMRGQEAKKIHRGNMLDESLLILRMIFEQDVATYKGECFDIREVQSYPKPVQRPFPFYIGGNSPDGRKRTAKFGQGWLPAVLSPEEIKSAVEEIKQHCEDIGRDHSSIDIAPQLAVSIGKSFEESMQKFKEAQLFKHLESLKKSTLKNQDTSDYAKRNLIGSPAEICEKIHEYVEAGVTTFSALLFAVNSIDEMVESMQFFAEEVIPQFR